MRIYNSDGSEPEMCGNGIRCFAQFLKDLGADGQFIYFSSFLANISSSHEYFVYITLSLAESYRVNTLAGPITPVMNPDSTITVDMGEPILDGPAVPTTLTPNAEFNSVVEQTHTDNNGKQWKISAVSMGNPHAVIYVDDLEKDVNFEVDGPALEGDTGAFPAKTNVEFCQGTFCTF